MTPETLTDIMKLILQLPMVAIILYVMDQTRKERKEMLEAARSERKEWMEALKSEHDDWQSGINKLIADLTQVERERNQQDREERVEDRKIMSEIRSALDRATIAVGAVHGFIERLGLKPPSGSQAMRIALDDDSKG